MSNERHETVTDNVSANHQFREVAKMIPHEEVAVSKMETTTPTREESSVVGNSAAMRDALMEASIALSSAIHHHMTDDDAKECLAVIESAISAPPRNCDVGTAEEQEKRFYAFCGYNRFQSGIKGMCSSLCPCIRCRDMCNCLTKWSQMPYEKGGAK